MYLMINGVKHSVTDRIVRGNTIKYTAVFPAPAEISGNIEMYRDDGFLLSSDNADEYRRKEVVGALVTISKTPAPTPQPSLESRVQAIEDAIERGLSM